MNIDEVDEYALDRHIVREGGLAELVQMVWHIVEPATELKWNWHLDLICKHLEAVSKGEILRLLVNIPPGSMKSLLISVFWKVWEWTERPGTAWMNASFDGSLTLKQANQVIKILESDFFQKRWGSEAVFTPEEIANGAQRITFDKRLAQAASEFSLEQGGYSFATSVGGKGTGRHVDIQIVDDPIKPKDARGGNSLGARLKEVSEWWGTTMSNRHKDPKTFRRVIVMQRLHQSDLAGLAIKAGEYVCVVLPMEFEGKRKCKTEWGEDPRTEDGELLWPDRFDEKWVANAKKPTELGISGYNAQCQQRPSPPGGGVFKAANRRHWKQGQLPTRFDQIIQSWDCTFKNLETSDFVAGGIWGIKDSDFYMLDGVNARMTLTETCNAIIAWQKKWPFARAKIIEDKANGPAVADVLARKVPGLILVNPLGGKEVRANACEPYWTAGNIWLPELSPENSTWFAPMIEDQLEYFPNSEYDDLIDQMTQAILYLETKNMAGYVAGIKEMKGGLAW